MKNTGLHSSSKHICRQPCNNNRNDGRSYRPCCGKVAVGASFLIPGKPICNCPDSGHIMMPLPKGEGKAQYKELPKLLTKPVRKVTIVKTQMAMFIVFFGPILSERIPEESCAIAYPKKKIEPNQPTSTGVRLRSCWI